MTFMPGKPIPGTYTTDWQRTDLRCQRCRVFGSVLTRKWESDDGAFEDWRYDCQSCGYHWWVEGPDA